MKKIFPFIGLKGAIILIIFTSIGMVVFAQLAAYGENLQAGIQTYLPIVEKPDATPTPTLTPTATQPPAPSATPTHTPTVVDVQVGVNGDQFSPQEITIHVGDTVRWTWVTDGHTVTSGAVPGTADGLFCSPNNTDCSTINTSNTGAVYQRTFTQTGAYPYFCQIHFFMGMTGLVTVKP